MSKCKPFFSWFLVAITILIAFGLFPFLSYKLPDYIDEIYSPDVFKQDMIDNNKFLDEIYPCQYYDSDNTEQYCDYEILANIEKLAADFLQATTFTDIAIKFDFSEEASIGNSRFVYIKDYIFSVDNTSYILNLVYDTNENKIVTLHCDSGGEYDRDVISTGEKKLKQLISEFDLSADFSGGDHYYEDARTINDSLADYLIQVSLIHFPIDLLSISNKEIDITLNKKDIWVRFSTNDGINVVLFWNPFSEKFEGYFINYK